MTFTLTEGRLQIQVESAVSALQYDFPAVVMVEEVFLDDADAKTLRVPSREWCTLWQTLPESGEVRLECRARQRAVTLQHTDRRWAAVIHAQHPADFSASISCSSRVARAMFTDRRTTTTFALLAFLPCGAVRWASGNVTIYLAQTT